LFKRSGLSLLLGEALTAGSIPGSCFLSTEHRWCYLHQRSPEHLNRCDSSAHRQVKPILAYFLAACKKVRRLAGRDPPVLLLTCTKMRVQT